ncbi:hypothetical protein PENSPDRAFT_686656 [Peniophora sp. CONT]|nr:hypothetical protein PENSPDRAFT_686656 [Peniophora sp. CONT]
MASVTSSETRARRRAEVDRATEVQTRAAIFGGLQYGLVGAGAATIAHYSWPAFRKQTLAGKAFLVSIVGIYGFVMNAESALMAHENAHRKADGNMRRAARAELTSRGIVPTETEILKWQRERETRTESAN